MFGQFGGAEMRGRAFLAFIVVVLVAIPVRSVSAATDHRSAGCSATWARVPSAPLAADDSSLQGVAAVSSSDVWAVGFFIVGAKQSALIEHWGGSEWSVTPNPPGLGLSWLQAVHAVAANDVWAVGGRFVAGRTNSATLTMHWDGAEWSIVDSPNIDLGPNSLLGVHAVGANDVWAVGHRVQPIKPIAIHWDGASWTLKKAGLSQFDQLFDVWSAGISDTWAAGAIGASASFIKRWDGATWQDTGAHTGSEQLGIDGVSPADVWSVGTSNTTAEHWNGAAWHAKSIHAVPGSLNNQFEDVQALASNDVWAGGWWQPANGESRTLIEHWDGTGWRVATSQNGRSHTNFLQGISLADGQGWAVGFAFRNAANRPLVLHACGV
jgi:hypothetical protein